MITFVLAAAVLVGALCVAVALDGAATEGSPGVAAHVLAARLLATDGVPDVADYAGRVADEKTHYRDARHLERRENDLGLFRRKRPA
jgi:hypothetical protein